jgi:hypothetical protein
MAKSNLHRYTVQEGLNILSGGGGADIVAASGADVTLNAHSYVAITALTEAVATVTSNDTDIWDSGEITIPAGTTVYGNWSQVVIADGDRAMVYRELSTD